MADVFISYRRATRGRAELLKVRLEALGYSTFFDLEGIDAGATFPQTIDRELKAAKTVLACLCGGYFGSDWCMIEARFAREKGKLVPVVVEPFEPDIVPVDLHYVQRLDLTGWRGEDDHEDWRKALSGIERLVGRAPKSGTVKAPIATPESSYANLVAGARARLGVQASTATDPGTAEAFIRRARETLDSAAVRGNIDIGKPILPTSFEVRLRIHSGHDRVKSALLQGGAFGNVAAAIVKAASDADVSIWVVPEAFSQLMSKLKQINGVQAHAVKQ